MDPLDKFVELAAQSRSVAHRIVAQVPQLARGLVWCRCCGREDRIVAAYALREGWPKCCGQTMTIDSPEERVAPPVRERSTT